MARYPLPERLPNGRLRYVSRVANTKVEAVVALAELRKRVQSGVESRPAIRTVAGLLDAWIEVKTGDIRASTLDQYRWAVAHILPSLGGARSQLLQPHSHAPHQS